MRAAARLHRHHRALPIPKALQHLTTLELPTTDLSAVQLHPVHLNTRFAKSIPNVVSFIEPSFTLSAWSRTPLSHFDVLGYSEGSPSYFPSHPSARKGDVHTISLNEEECDA